MKQKMTVRFIANVGVLAALASVIQLLDFPLPIFPGFLKIDFGELPALIGAFAFGPLAGVCIELIKNLVHLVARGSTGGVGELANFLVGIGLVVPAAWIYVKTKTKNSALLGMAAGTIFMTLFAALLNYFVMIPLYTNFMPLEAIIGMGSAVIPAIKDTFTLILFGIVPFNLFKGILVSVITLLLYKRVSPILHR